MATDFILDMDFNLTKAEAKMKKLQADFDKAVEKTEELKDKITDANEKIAQTKENQAKLREEMRKATDEAGRLEMVIDRIKSGDATTQEIIDVGGLDKASTELETQISKIKKMEAEYDKNQTTIRDQERLIRKTNAELTTQNAKLSSIGANMKDTVSREKQLNSGWSKFRKNIESTDKSFKRFGKRFASLVSSALFFTVVTKAFTAMRDSIGQILQKDKQLMKEWNQIKVNLQVICMQLYETIKPALSWILGILNTITQVISFILTTIFGKGAKSTKEMAEYMGDTADNAEKAGKATASFDTLQTASGSGSSNSSDSSDGLDYANASNIKTKTDEELVKIATISGIAMLGLGLILMLTGVNIPLGLFLTVAGGLTVYKTIKENWNTLDEPTKQSLQRILTIAGDLMLALGIILLCCGIVPLGIGLIIAGSALLASAVAISPETFVETVKGILRDIENEVSKFIDWISVNLFDDLFGTGFGNALKEMWKNYTTFFKDVIAFFEGVFKGDWEKVGRALVNILVDLINMVTNNFNLFIQKTLGSGAKLINAFGELFGQKWNLDASNVKIPNIPRLATGAVLPGGKPYMAWVNDQPKGQTNIEAPLDTIVEAFKRVGGGQPQNITITAEGSMAQFIKMLNLKIKEEDKRASVW